MVDVSLAGGVAARSTAASDANSGSGVFVRFKLLAPVEVSYSVQVGVYIRIEPWRLPATVRPAGANSDRSKRVGSGAFTDWFDVGKYAGTKLHGQLSRAGGVAEFPNITVDFVASANSPTRKVVIELATAPTETAVVKRFEESFTGSVTAPSGRGQGPPGDASEMTARPTRLGARGQCG
jgi:hypothetical protein